jgi:hypothetical protein
MARLRFAAVRGGSRLAIVSLILVLVAAVTGLLLIKLGGWGGGSVEAAAAAVYGGARCPACPACPAHPASQRPTAIKAAQKQQAAASAAEQQQPGGSSPGSLEHPAGVPLLCGGPEQVPLVAVALANSTAELYPGVHDAFEPWKQGFTEVELQETAERVGADKAAAELCFIVTVRLGPCPNAHAFTPTPWGCNRLICSVL